MGYRAVHPADLQAVGRSCCGSLRRPQLGTSERKTYGGVATSLRKPCTEERPNELPYVQYDRRRQVGRDILGCKHVGLGLAKGEDLLEFPQLFTHIRRRIIHDLVDVRFRDSGVQFETFILEQRAEHEVDGMVLVGFLHSCSVSRSTAM